MSADAKSAYGKRLFGRKKIQIEQFDAKESTNISEPQSNVFSSQVPPQSQSTMRSFSSSGYSGALVGTRPQPQLGWREAPVQPDAVGETSTMISRLQLRIQSTLADQVTPLRLASHLSVVLVAAIVLLFSQTPMPDWDFQLVAMPTTTQSGFKSVSQQVTTYLTGQNPTPGEGLAFQPQIVPFTIIPERTRQVIQTYSVQAGDTVLGIAYKFKLKPETLQWSNPNLEQNPDTLRIGDQVKILPVDGVLHTVRAGDTLSALATRYKVTPEQIVAYEANDLPDSGAQLTTGAEVVVPGGVKPYITQQVATTSSSPVSVPFDALKGSGSFRWPAGGSISQNYWGGHPGIDIASRTGASVKAADGGFVVLAGSGWNGGYGNHVIIDHGNGFTTLYAHLNTIFVRTGENVSTGQQIGTVGNTGNSTGPHLHFEIRYQGYPRNPYSLLP